jgi:hypothetical protein
MTDKAYTPAEASAVIRLPLKAVHKGLDSRRIRPKRSRQGIISSNYCPQRTWSTCGSHHYQLVNDNNPDNTFEFTTRRSSSFSGTPMDRTTSPAILR